MNRKGQALVEFVLILPILLLLILAIIDFGRIYNTKNELENNSTDIVLILENGTEINEIKTIYNKLNIELSNYNDKFYKVTISKKIKLITPGFNKIFSNPYEIKVERVVPYVE